uniref:Uncharacterized protein n=1 Tax=Anguilla anguilla TaxID=7936 RepID=A0A0E9RSF7_ANGAN
MLPINDIYLCFHLIHTYPIKKVNSNSLTTEINIYFTSRHKMKKHFEFQLSTQEEHRTTE